MREKALGLTCDCGIEVTGLTLDELIGHARLHARREHGMDLPAPLIVELIQNEQDRRREPGLRRA